MFVEKMKKLLIYEFIYYCGPHVWDPSYASQWEESSIGPPYVTYLFMYLKKNNN